MITVLLWMLVYLIGYVITAILIAYLWKKNRWHEQSKEAISPGQAGLIYGAMWFTSLPIIIIGFLVYLFIRFGIALNQLYHYLVKLLDSIPVK